MNNQYDQPHDEIEIRESILNSYKLNEEGQAEQYYLLFNAYDKIKNIKKMQKILNVLEKNYSHTTYGNHTNIEFLKSSIESVEKYY